MLEITAMSVVRRVREYIYSIRKSVRGSLAWEDNDNDAPRSTCNH